MVKKINCALTLLLISVSFLIGNSDVTSDLAPISKMALKEYPAPTPTGTDSIPWVTKTPSPSPGRYWCPAVAVYRDTIYLLGGRGDGGYANSIRLVYGYVPATNSWVTNFPSLLITRRAGAGGQVGNKVYLCGGRDSTHTTLSSCEEYDLDTKTSVYKASMPGGRWSCSGVGLNGKVYVFGSETYSDALLEYNPATNSWRTITPTPRPPGRGWTAVATAGGKLYVLGGSSSSGTLSDCWEFDPNTETWTQKANMPGPRIYHSAIGFGDDNIYVIGGSTDGTIPADRLVYKYTISTNTWVTETPIPTARGWEMLAVHDGTIYVMCGSDCTTPTYLTVNEAGEIEVPRDHDVGVRSIISPTGRIPSSNPINVSAVIKNFGLNEETFPATALITTQTDDTVFAVETTLTIPARTEQSVVFGEWTPDPDMVYDVMFYTALVGDENPANDTLTGEARTTPDAGVLRIVAPTVRVIPGTTVNATAMVKNFSAEPKDVPATMTIVDTVSGSTILDVDTTLTMGAGETLSVVFGQFTATSGSVYDVIAYTSLAGDDDPSNDTAYAMAVCRLGSAPDPFGYYYESTQEPGDTVTFSWIDPTGGTVLTGWSPSADDGYVTRTLPFGFKFYSPASNPPNINQINVCTNGFLETSTMTTYTNTALPNNTIQNFIGPFWDDLNLTSQGQVIEKVGTDGQYVSYTWLNVPRFGTSELQTFQVVLYRDNKIRFNYLDVNGTLNSNTIGIQGGIGANGWYQQYVFDGNPANHIVTDNTTIQFTCDSLRGIAEVTRNITPTATFLHPVRPNPVAKGEACISFTLAKKGNVAINIYDATGRLVRNLINSVYDPGSYNVTWDGKGEDGMPAISGIYFYTIKTQDYKATKKLVLMR
uniref:T9SS C-terminal target domain-containing protein n=1 Tax=candidate division WOR-3 bacterium TaxID=2052148 RepID=A0A7C6A8B0_UNCW3